MSAKPRLKVPGKRRVRHAVVAAAARDGLIRGAKRAPVPSIAVAMAFSMSECICAARVDCDPCYVPDASIIDAALADSGKQDVAEGAADALGSDAGVDSSDAEDGDSD